MVRHAMRTALLLVNLLVAAGPAIAQPTGPTLAPGQSATPLPDGRWLLIGGDGASGPQGTVVVWDPGTRARTALPVTLDTPRSGHAATLLPDGTVLVAGGVGPDGQVLDTLVRIDPATAAMDSVPAFGVTPRMGHTATVLPDGRVLVAGGVSAAGTVLATAEVWDPLAGQATAFAATLGVGRFGHTATLQPDGTVLLWGGQDAQGAALTVGERLDPGAHTVAAVPAAPPTSADPPTVAAVVPADGAVDVLPDARIALRFSSPLQVESVSGQTVFLSGPQGFEPARVVPVEGGRLVFITPAAPLQAGALYEVVVNGPVDAAGRPVPFTSVHFSTAPGSGPSGSGSLASGSTPQASADPPASLASSSADDVWTLDVTATGPGRWRTGWPDSPWRTLAPLRAAPGVTALAGQVLTLRGDPLPDVTLGIGSQSARTDATGRFLLPDLPPGHQELLIDGRSATRSGRVYGVFEVGVDLTAGQTTVLPYTIWMPRIDTDHAVTIPSPTPTEVVVTTPRIPGLELRLPAGAVITDHEHRPVTQLTITPIPLDRPPFPLAIGVEPPAYFTIQPGGGYLYAPSGRGAQLIYPNTLGWSPGAYAHFWHYSPEGPGWYVYGNGRVTPDGRRVLPDPGTQFYEFTGAMAQVPWLGPSCPLCPPPPTPPPAYPEEPINNTGDPVELTTGHFLLRKTDLVVPDVMPLALTRTYRSGETPVRAFGRGMMHPYDLWLRSPNAQDPYQTLDLTLPTSATVRFVRTSGGPGFADSVLEHKTTPTVWHGSKIVWNGSGWDLTRRDGMVYVFGDNAPLREIRDRFGNRVTVDRVNASLPAYKVTSPHGRWIEFTLTVISGWQLITQARDNLGRVVTYQYDAQLRLWKVTDPAGGVTEYGYDAAHTLTTIKDARGIVYLKNEYTGTRVTRQVLADGTRDALDPTNTRAYQFTYTVDPQGWSTQVDVTDPRGHLRQVTNQPAGYLLTDTQALGRPEQQVTTYTRDAATNLMTSRVENTLNNRQTTYTYNAKGDLLTITRAVGLPEQFPTTFTYEDNALQPVISQLKTITLPGQPPTTLTYNAQGAVTQLADPLGHLVTITPNPKGQPTAIATHSTPSATETTQFGYDALGDLVTITDPLNRVTTRFLDDAGRLLAVTDPLGRRTRYEYDALNRLTKGIDPGGGTTQFQYDNNGNLRFVTDARSKMTEYTYDNADRVTTRKDPLLRTESFQYDGMDNLTQGTDRKGQVATFTYDALQRRTVARFSAAGPVTSLSYDAAHRLTRVDHSANGTTNIQTITRTYTGLDQLTQETAPQGTVSATYDAASRRATMTVAGQSQVVYTYDNADRLTQLIRGSNTYTFGYDDANRRSLVTLPNGLRIESGYDDASQLRTIDYRNGFGGPLLGTLTYDYDLAGQRTKIGGTWARTGLPTAVASASHDDANQLTSWGGTSLTYDLNGNLATLTDAGGTTTHTWNPKNELTALSGPGLTGSFEYDGLGRRTKRVVGGTTRDFVYDGLTPVQEKQGNQVKANLVPGLGLDAWLTRIEGNTTRHFLPDALGSTLALTDTAGGVQTSYAYEPFGQTTVTGQTSTNTFKYTGREDDGTGLYYYRARYYHPGLQRFIAEDPIEFSAGDGNLYAYAFDNPVNLVDPIGLAPLIVPLPNYCQPAPVGRKDPSSNHPPDQNPLIALILAISCDPNSWLPMPAAAPFSQNQRVLIELARMARRTGIGVDDAWTLFRWAREYGLPAHPPAVHVGRPGAGAVPHINIGPIRHIPIK